jgi:quercetin dioxygenase-like cupin family protein
MPSKKTEELPEELLVVRADFSAALEQLRGEGARLDSLYPAEEPHTGILEHRGQRIRLTSRPDAPPIPHALPDFRPQFVVTRAGSGSTEGRAGMRYRDLIPGQLGGRYVASHITIAEGGPVADWVHYHRIAVQLICVRAGWVRVVYEDQGDPFVMAAGDMVLQPPGIRHRVLESSPGLEVVEITCPALHETCADHALALPNGRVDPRRVFGGQRFLHHVAADTPWIALQGGTAQATGLSDASGGLVDARTLERGGGSVIRVPPHDGELVFGFVIGGSARLEHGGGYDLGAADAFVIPPGEGWQLTDASADFRLLHVTTAAVPNARPALA